MITTFAAFFAFGYCVADIILNYRANKRIDEFLSDLNQPNNFDD
jgi:hypothetical protein